MPTLTEAQRRTYKAETAENFRLVAKLFAHRSPHRLTANDLVPTALQLELADIGQFAELAHGKFSPSFIWSNITQLSKPGFPLEEYHALNQSILVAAFRGDVANMQGYIAYRPQTKQLVVAFSGTSSFGQTLRNLDVRLIAYPGGDGCAVHSGFWKMYQGVRSHVLEHLTRALSEDRSVDELILTGHSLGAAMCYLVALDLMSASSEIQLPLKLVLFGSPRVGNSSIVRRWRTTMADRASRGSPVTEFSTKGHNDGVPSLPPYSLGYRHFAQMPLYSAHGRLYHILATESECSSFSVEASASERQNFDHPRGGHMYYNSRDMEKLQRRMTPFQSTHGQSTEVDWEQYQIWLSRVREREEGTSLGVTVGERDGDH